MWNGPGFDRVIVMSKSGLRAGLATADRIASWSVVGVVK